MAPLLASDYLRWNPSSEEQLRPVGIKWLASSPMIVFWNSFLGKQREHGVGKALDFQKTLGKFLLCLEAGRSRHAIGFLLTAPRDPSVLGSLSFSVLSAPT